MLHVRSIAVSDPYGLPLGSLTIMVLMAANEDSSQADLSQASGMPASYIVKIVDVLEEKGLVLRVRSRNDRRKNLMQLTDKGQEIMKALFADVKEIESPIRDELDGKELVAFIDYIDRSIAALRSASSDNEDLSQARPSEAR